MNNMLSVIAARKQDEIAQAKEHFPLSQLKQQISTSDVRDFIAALNNKRPAIIAEIKKGSPSKGIIRSDFNVAAIASDYDANGAACLSVLTDESFFYGHGQNIAIAKQHSTCPVLRKDFILDPYQIYESRYLGADCILLIVAMLTAQQLHDYCYLAQELNMAVLVESHDESELEQALTLPTPLMGINNRNLNNFTTDLNTSVQLSKLIPNDRIIISESGIDDKEDLVYLDKKGIHTFLIGETFMRAPSPGKKLRSLVL